ncbi:plasmid pRiA4b ORF-3 family protein [Cryobacterium glaciale]|uniref:Plasmid pRiA4b ORF-3 family protein n=1 Tax=Cryobacterium glaciale TaxID=1259145 RepID=A0A4R8UYT0_9MICO|nr:plasmid pRiA4b ORF-3 family protein [Cryobacterium glaciale]TFB73199.1 plasmid pRiA4b ORF-3 family protein [Cryobacterium glaciale]
MTTPRNQDFKSDNLTDFAEFKARLGAISVAGAPSVGAAMRDLSTGTFPEAPLKPLPLKKPPATPVQFRLRVDLEDSHPPIWRRVIVPSNMTLDVLHAVLQTSFGWTDSHLHRFALTGDRYARQTQEILTPYDIAEGEEGMLEIELRLDQLVAKKGDSLLYTYDFGDDWDHTIKLEEVLPATDAAVRCIDGRRQGPAEDVGGIHGWEHLLAVAAGTVAPDYPEEREIAFEMGLHAFVDEIDLAEINRGLERLAGSRTALISLRQQSNAGEEPSPLVVLLAGLSEQAQRHLAGYLAAAKVEEPVEVGEPEAAAATAVIRAFLEHVGAGIRLTSAGYLPPVHVKALMRELDIDKRWQGEANREAQTYPLLILRETLTQFGLIRKYRGELRLTKRGAQLRETPVELWHHVAARLPVERTDYGHDCALLLLLLVAAGDAGEWERTRQSLDLLTSMVGWSFGGRGRYGNESALNDASDTRRVLGWAGTGGLLPPRGLSSHGLDTDASRRLARAALITWA